MGWRAKPIRAGGHRQSGGIGSSPSPGPDPLPESGGGRHVGGGGGRTRRGRPGRKKGREGDLWGGGGQAPAEAALTRELAPLHQPRHETFLHGSPDALREHSSRLAALEGEYLRRHSDREVDPARTRSGA